MDTHSTMNGFTRRAWTSCKRVIDGFFVSMGVIGICLFVALWNGWLRV